MYASAFGHREIVLLILAAFRQLHHVTYLGQRNLQGLTATELAEYNGHTDLASLLRVEREIAPRPSGPSSFIPAAPHDLDRPPTPSETLTPRRAPDRLGEPTAVSPIKEEALSGEFRGRCVSKGRNVHVLPPDLEEQQILNHLRNHLYIPSSPGSGNEADTESLMDADRITLEDLDTETATTMAASVAAAAASRTSIIAPSSSNIITSSVHSSSGHNISKGQAAGQLPSRKVTLATHTTTLTSSEQMPKIDLSSSNKSLNKCIRGLMQDDIDMRPGHRPPTPARPSLPTLLPGSGRFLDAPLNCLINSTKTEGKTVPNRRITLMSLSRSSSEPQPLSSPQHSQQQNEYEESTSDLDSSTKSDGWEQLLFPKGRNTPAGVTLSEGHVVPLPPIGRGHKPDITTQGRENGKQKNTNVLNVAKKTLEQLETVLANDDINGLSRHQLSRTRTHQHLHMST